MTESPVKVLFVSYDGNGQSYLDTLFIPILGGIDREIAQVNILEFCPPARHAQYRALAEAYSIPAHFAPYHNKPPIVAALWSIWRGARMMMRMVGRGDINVLHPRSYIAGTMALLVKMARPTVGLIFDSDGLMPDERVEFGNWNPNGLVYKLFRFIERQLLKRANVVITRTKAAQLVLMDRAGGSTDHNKFVVIPNGKDASLFRSLANHERQKTRQRYGLGMDAPLIVYAGSLGPKYSIETMLLFFSCLRKLNSRAHLLLLTGGSKVSLLELARKYGVPATALTTGRVSPEQVPALLASSDVGMDLLAPGQSICAISPIKVCEYLLCGTPVLANAGIGDLDSLLKNNPEVACLLQNTSAASLEEAAKWVVEGVMPRRKELMARCRRLGLERFGLDAVQLNYAKVYERF